MCIALAVHVAVRPTRSLLCYVLRQILDDELAFDRPLITPLSLIRA